MNAVNAFWCQDMRSFHHLNDAYMVLLRKKDNPEEIRDFRPISLIHSFGKLVTKCMANRLAGVLDRLVLRNQSAFIKGRSIHDNFQAVQLACKAVHATKKPCVLLKIDIAKAFDTVSWEFLLDVLQHMGFGLRCRNWVATALSSASTRILLNGKAGRRVCHARGLRQGDLLSPMLFVIAMDVLNHFFKWIEDQGFLSPTPGIGSFRVSLYADDLVLFVTPHRRDLEVVKATLQIFGLASGLFSNLDKSVATPMHCSDEDMLRVQSVLACGVQQFPCRYLGIPLSVYKLKRADEQPLVDKVAARIPGWKGQLLNAAGRTALISATLSAVPVHTMIAVCLSPWAVKAIDKARRAFLWAGTESVGAGRCKVAWPTCSRPKQLGGLGISDLRRAGVALRVRWLWRERSEGRASAQADPAALALFSAAAVLNLGNGRSTLFWKDRWLDGQCIKDLAPAVFQAVKPRKRNVTVAEALQNDVWVRHLRGPVTAQLLLEISRLFDRLVDINLSSEPDTFRWGLTADGEYSAASAYGAMFLGSSATVGAKQLWKTRAPPRVRFFVWLILHGRCWTAERRFRHGLQNSDVCIICDQSSETMDHLVLGCVFSREVWGILLRRLHLGHLVIGEQPVIDWWLQARKTMDKPFRAGFDSFFFLMAWNLWKERNARTFQRVQRTASRLANDIQQELNLWCSAGYRGLSALAARSA